MESHSFETLFKPELVVVPSTNSVQTKFQVIVDLFNATSVGARKA